MFAGLVVGVVDLPLPDGDLGPAAPSHGHPAARRVVSHHHLSFDLNDGVATAQKSEKKKRR